MVNQNPYDGNKEIYEIIKSAYEYCSQFDNVIPLENYLIHNIISMSVEILFEQEIEIIDLMGNNMTADLIGLYIRFLLENSENIFIDEDGQIKNNAQYILIGGIDNDRRIKTKYIGNI